LEALLGGYVTQEKRIVFDLTDIKMVRHRCPKCQGEVSHKAEDICVNRFPKQCPLCGFLWGDFKDPLFERHCQFLKILKKMLETPNQDIQLKLEIDGNPQEESKENS
jgi:hypothetical protein